MSEKYALKVIQHGQTQQVKVLRPGAGIAGQAVVVKATNAARFQLADMVTLVAPQKVQLKRVDGNLHLALPGGDIDAPDLVIQDYFNVNGATLQGATISGEMLSYDTSGLASTSVSVFDKAQAAITGEATDANPLVKTEAVTLGEGGSMFSSPWAWAGVLGAGAALGGGGGGGGGSSSGGTPTPTPTGGLGTLKAYADGSGKAPSLATYKSAGVKALDSLNETTATQNIDDPSVTAKVGSTWQSALNSALAKQTGSSLSVAQLQAMANSYYRILSEADGVVNTTTDVDVKSPLSGGGSSNNPTVSDYTNIGATLGNTKSVDLLNDYVGAASKTQVDSVAEIDAIAKAAYNVMLLAGVASASGTAPKAYSTTDNNAEWIKGLNTLLGISTISTSNIVAVKKAIEDTKSLGTASDGLEVDTVQEIKDLLKPALALQLLQKYANANNGSGVTTPTLSTYKDAGVKALTNLSESTASADIDSGTVYNVMGGSDKWLTALNSALDKQTNAALKADDLQKMVDSYYRILSEADGVVNSSTAGSNVDVYPNVADVAGDPKGNNDPSAADYAAIGATVGNAKSVDLLNDYVGASAKEKVDTVDEINTIAKAAYNVMQLAGVTSTTPAAGTVVPAIYSDKDKNVEWIAGMNALLDGTTVNASNIAAVKKAIADTAAKGTANDGLEVDTLQEIKDLIKVGIALQKLKDFTLDARAIELKINGDSAPKLEDYSGAGIKTFKSLTDTTDTNRKDLGSSDTSDGAVNNTFLTVSALNTALDKLDGSTLTVATVQAMVDAYYRILSEADGVVNTTTNVDVLSPIAGSNPASTSNDPLAADYAAIGATVGNAKSVDLLNDYVGAATKDKVDTVNEIDAIAKAAYNVMLLAGVSAGTGKVPLEYSTTDKNDEWIKGMNALLDGATVNAGNIAAVKKAIADTAAKGTANDGVEVDTLQEIKDLIKVGIALQKLKDFTLDSGAIGFKNTSTPTFDDYKNLGIKTFNSLADTSHSKDFNDSSTANQGVDNTFLTVSALNTALDKLDGATLDASKVQAMVDAYYRILSEADGVTNTAVAGTNVDVYPSTGADDPLAADYAAIGATVGNDKSVDLLNDYVGAATKDKVDTVDEINAIAKAAYNVMQLAGVTSTTPAAGTVVPAIYSATDKNVEWIAGMNALLGGTTVNAGNIGAVKAAITASATLGTANDGLEVDTVQEIKDLIKVGIALQKLKDFTLDSGAIGFKTPTTITPTLADYTDLGIKTFNSLADTSHSKDFNDSTTANQGVSNTFLTAAILNTALDKLDGATLDASKVQAMVDAYYRILSEADGVANTAVAGTNVDVYPATGADDPLAADYAAIGATVGNAKSVDLLNDYVGAATKDKVDTVDEIDAIAKAAYNVMKLAGVASTTPAAGTVVPALYTTANEWIAGMNALLGSTTVNAGNIEAVQNAIKNHADGTAVDTVQEIKDLIKVGIALQKLKDFTLDSAAIGFKGAATPTLTDYTDLGIKTFKSLADTSVGSRKDLNDSSTANGSESNTFLTAAILNTALDKLDGATLDASKVQAMVDAYYRVLREADGDTALDTDVYADTTYDATNANAYNDPTLADYMALGVAVDDGSGAGTVYSAATGAGNETLDLLNDAVGRLNTGAVDTVTKLQTLATTANDVMLLAKGSSASQTDANLIVGLNALLNLNISTGVNTSNISSFKTVLATKNDNGSETDSVNELLGLLAQVRLTAFTDDSGNYYVTSAGNTKNTAIPSLNDWSVLGTGLKANTSLVDSTLVALNQSTYWKTTNAINGLQALNSALDNLAGSAVTQTKLQGIVHAYGRILQEADGSRATDTNVSNVASGGDNVVQADLEAIGVKFGGTNGGATVGTDTGLYYQKTGELLASTIGSLNSTSVDTIQELNTLVDYAEVVMKQAAGATPSYSDSEWVTALNSLLGTNTNTGVNLTNIADIKNNISGVANVDTWDELQAKVSLVRLDDYAAQSTGWTTPVIGDYQAIMATNGGAYTDANSASGNYLTAYNSAVDSLSSVTGGVGIKDMVLSYNKVLDLADGSRTATTPSSPSDTDYGKIFGVTTVSSTQVGLLNSVIDGLSKDKVDTVSEINGLITAVNKVYTLVTSGTGTLSRTELTSLGLTDGNGHTVSDINPSTASYWITDSELNNFQNTQLKINAGGFSGADQFQELQQLLNAAILAA